MSNAIAENADPISTESVGRDLPGITTIVVRSACSIESGVRDGLRPVLGHSRLFIQTGRQPGSPQSMDGPQGPGMTTKPRDGGQQVMKVARRKHGARPVAPMNLLAARAGQTATMHEKRCAAIKAPDPTDI